MIRFHGVETVRGYPREAVFVAALVKENWPTAAGVRIGPDAEVLKAGGRVRAMLELPGLVLTLAGQVTRFELGSRIEASGTQAGIWAGSEVRMADNADRVDDGDIETLVTWQFEARLPFWLVMLELPATAAIKLAIPTLTQRFIANILQHLDDREIEPEDCHHVRPGAINAGSESDGRPV